LEDSKDSKDVAITAELLELFDLLEERADHLTHPFELAPLSIHARHSLVEIFSAFGRITPGKFYQHREGVYRDEATNSDLFFVTLEKSERDYSPSTLYKDYAISPTLFHWESQSTTSVNSLTGRRYVDGSSTVLLFVRQEQKDDFGTSPYLFLGPATYVTHTGDRPIAITWRLETPMPTDFFNYASAVAQ